MKSFTIVALLALCSSAFTMRVLEVPMLETLPTLPQKLMAAEAAVIDESCGASLNYTGWTGQWADKPARGTTVKIDMSATAVVDTTLDHLKVETFFNGGATAVDTRTVAQTALHMDSATIAAGDQPSMGYENSIPLFSPLGDYRLRVNFHPTATGDADGCLDVTFTLV